jgi:cell division protein FtsL
MRSRHNDVLTIDTELILLASVLIVRTPSVVVAMHDHRYLFVKRARNFVSCAKLREFSFPVVTLRF